MSRGDVLRVTDWFAGAGGATQGCVAVPGVLPVLAANHDQLAIETHSTNFPNVEHFRGDIRDLDVSTHPYAELFWASPECTNWSQAKGVAVDFDVQPGLFGDPEIADDVARSRALMQDVIRYLEGMHLRHQPVLAGVVENVVDIRKWDHWHVWRRRIERLGYRTRLIAFNSMHAAAVRTPRAPQSRDRLYLAYWHESIGRDPDWDRWLRPDARCPSCEETVAAVQVWRRPGVDMGRYGQQYDYRCPKVSCRGQRVDPVFTPAAAAIDWSLPGQRIGDRDRPLAPKTRARIAAGARRYARPVIIEAGGHQYDAADPNHPQHGEPGAYYRTWPADAEPLRTLHTSLTKGIAFPPIVTEFRGGGSVAHSTAEALSTLTAGGNHHGLVVPPLVMRNNSGGAEMSTHVLEPLRTVTTAGHQSLLTWPGPSSPVPVDNAPAVSLSNAEWDRLVDDCLFRMLEPHEIHAGMAFTADYVVLGSKRQKVKQLGNAVTPPVAEVLFAALVECITGDELDLASAA